ncbi:unnamed protein product, partial [Prorocentrum cordatum]
MANWAERSRTRLLPLQRREQRLQTAESDKTKDLRHGSGRGEATPPCQTHGTVRTLVRHTVPHKWEEEEDQDEEEEEGPNLEVEMRRRGVEGTYTSALDTLALRAAARLTTRQCCAPSGSGGSAASGAGTGSASVASPDGTAGSGSSLTGSIIASAPPWIRAVRRSTTWPRSSLSSVGRSRRASYRDLVPNC